MSALAIGSIRTSGGSDWKASSQAIFSRVYKTRAAARRRSRRWEVQAERLSEPAAGRGSRSSRPRSASHPPVPVPRSPCPGPRVGPRPTAQAGSPVPAPPAPPAVLGPQAPSRSLDRPFPSRLPSRSLRPRPLPPGRGAQCAAAGPRGAGRAPSSLSPSVRPRGRAAPLVLPLLRPFCPSPSELGDSLRPGPLCCPPIASTCSDRLCPLSALCSPSSSAHPPSSVPPTLPASIQPLRYSSSAPHTLLSPSIFLCPPVPLCPSASDSGATRPPLYPVSPFVVLHPPTLLCPPIPLRPQAHRAGDPWSGRTEPVCGEGPDKLGVNLSLSFPLPQAHTPVCLGNLPELQEKGQKGLGE
ncbi:translation initiation factor IF-2 [Mirounga angustirostris]|uniref:translation initiation factor IF-2 n=1 Tax=Mirounga angustirostris TaxID=9716 RepID=UPI00313AF7BA